MSKMEKRLLREQQQAQHDRETRALEKQQRRREKWLATMNRTQQYPSDGVDRTGPVDVACLIHSNGYSWDYVDRLFNMVTRNISRAVTFHVYTEQAREVPSHMVKHVLTEWPGIAGPRKSWWYKMQLFNAELFQGPMLYLDLDTVIVGRLDWITQLHTKFFWAPKDFRSLWRPTHTGINSSAMWWDTRAYDYIWQAFQKDNLSRIVKAYSGDQDYISEMIDHRTLRYFEPMAAQSWRWQCKDGGMNFKNRNYYTPGSGTRIDPRTSILVFHGQPKPAEIEDEVVKNFWM